MSSSCTAHIFPEETQPLCNNERKKTFFKHFKGIGEFETLFLLTKHVMQ